MPSKRMRTNRAFPPSSSVLVCLMVVVTTSNPSGASQVVVSGNPNEYLRQFDVAAIGEIDEGLDVRSKSGIGLAEGIRLVCVVGCYRRERAVVILHGLGQGGDG